MMRNPTSQLTAKRGPTSATAASGAVVLPGDRENQQADERESGIAEWHGRRPELAERREKAGPKERDRRDRDRDSRDQRLAHMDVVRVRRIGADPSDVARESTHHRLPPGRERTFGPLV